MAAKYGFLLLASLQFSQSLWTNVEVLGGENSKSGIILTSFKWGRMNRTTYVANGLFVITEDFSNAYDVMCSKGNNQLRLMWYGVPRMPLCDYIDGHFYRTVIQPDYEAHSNLPKIVLDQPLCPLFIKGNYTFIDYPLDGKRIIPKFADPGYYIVYMMYYKAGAKDFDSRRSYRFRLS